METGLLKSKDIFGEPEKKPLGSQFGGGWSISEIVKKEQEAVAGIKTSAEIFGEESEESKFQKAYKAMATKQGLSSDPDDPKHFYDYRALFKETGSLKTDATGHFPSKYKKEGHPEMVVEGIDTRTGEPVPQLEDMKVQENNIISMSKTYADLGQSLDAEYEVYTKLTEEIDKLEEEMQIAAPDMQFFLNQKRSGLVAQHNELVETLKGITKRHQDLFGQLESESNLFNMNVNSYNKYLEIEAKTQPQEDLPEYIKESDAKDVFDAFRLGASGIFHNTKQYFKAALPNLIYKDITVEETVTQYSGMTQSKVDKVNEFNKGQREIYKEKYQKGEDQYYKWLENHPELNPRPEWSKGVMETVKNNPGILKDPAYWAYVAAQSAAFTLGIMGTTLAVTAVTGNPFLGMAAGVGVAYPSQAQDLWQELVDNGATEEQASKLAVPIGAVIAAVEVMGDLPLLATVSKPFKKMLSRNITAAVGKKVADSILKSGLKTYTKVQIAEIIEEVLQGAIQDATVKTFNEDINLLEKIPETILQTAIAVTPFSIFGMGADVRSNIQERLKQKIAENNIKTALEEVTLPEEKEPVITEEPKTGPKVPGNIYIGEAFRAESGLMVKGKNAQEIVNFEAEELGNIDIKTKAEEIAQKLKIDLEQVSEKDVIWVADTLEIAKDYGKAEKVEISKDNIILADDGEGGYLILNNVDQYRKVEPKPAPPVPKTELQAPGEIYTGKAYRSETHIPEHGADVIAKMKTAQEKLDYDYGITANPIFKEAGKLAGDLGIELGKVPIKELVWVAQYIETAEKYDGAEEIEVTGDTIILAKDEEGGFLVLKNADKYRKAEPGAPKAEPEVKAPWEMTRVEFQTEIGKNVNKEGHKGKDEKTWTQWLRDIGYRPGDKDTGYSLHKEIIQQSIAENKPIPPEVLKDYPDLKVEPTSITPVYDTEEFIPENFTDPQRVSNKLAAQPEQPLIMARFSELVFKQHIDIKEGKQPTNRVYPIDVAEAHLESAIYHLKNDFGGAESYPEAQVQIEKAQAALDQLKAMPEAPETPTVEEPRPDPQITQILDQVNIHGKKSLSLLSVDKIKELLSDFNKNKTFYEDRYDNATWVENSLNDVLLERHRAGQETPEVTPEETTPKYIPPLTAISLENTVKVLKAEAARLGKPSWEKMTKREIDTLLKKVNAFKDPGGELLLKKVGKSDIDAWKDEEFAKIGILAGEKIHKITDSHWIFIDDKVADEIIAEQKKKMFDKKIKEYMRSFPDASKSLAEEYATNQFKEWTEGKEAPVFPDWKPILESAEKARTKDKTYIQGHITGEKENYTILSNGLIQVKMNSNYLNMINKWLPDAKIQLGEKPIDMVSIADPKTDKIQAIAMPVRQDEESKLPWDVWDIPGGVKPTAGEIAKKAEDYAEEQKVKEEDVGEESYLKRPGVKETPGRLIGGQQPLFPGMKGPLYHGTATEFEEFDISKAGTIKYSDWGKGIYLSPSKSGANYYRKEAIEETDKEANRLYKEFEDKAKEMGTSPMMSAINLGYGSDKYNELMEYDRRWRNRLAELREDKGGGRIIEVYIDEKAKVYKHIYEPGMITDPFLTETAKEGGYDVVEIWDRDPETKEEWLTETIVVNPEVIHTKQQLKEEAPQELSKGITKIENRRIDIKNIENRRFFYNPKTDELILGEEGTASGEGIEGTHANELAIAKPQGEYDDFLRGWIGTSKKYPDAVIHFAPAIEEKYLEDPKNADNFFKTIEYFMKQGANENTILRNAGKPGEYKMVELYPELIDYRELSARQWGQEMEKEEVTPKRINKTEIMTWADKAFGFPIKGKATHKWKAAGVFYHHKQIIRMQKWGELAVAAHEISHGIDDIISEKFGTKWKWGERKGITGEFTKELADLDYDQGDSGRRTAEGFAEYMRFELTQGLGKEKAPNFHKYFNESILTQFPEIKKNLDLFKQKLDIWNKQGAENRIIQHIDWKGEHSKTRGLLPKIQKALEWINVRFNDEFYFPQKIVRGIEEVIGKKLSPSKNPAILMEYSKAKSGAIARTFVMKNAIDEHGNVVGESLTDILKPIPNKEISQFIAYAVSMRASTLSARGIESGFDIDDAKFIIEKYKDKGWKATAKEVTEWSNHMLDWIVRAGGLSGDAAKLMRELNPIYLPFKRAFLDEISVTKGVGGYVDTGRAVKAIKGSGRPIINPIESLITQTRELIAKAQKIRIAKAFIDLAEEHGVGGFVTKVPTPMKATTFSANQIKNYLNDLIKKRTEGIDVDIEEGETIMLGNYDDFLTVFTQDFKYGGKENIVSVWKDGKQEFYEIHPDLYEAFKGVDPLKLGAIAKVFAPYARMLRLGATGLKLSFGLARNPFRDAFSYAVFSKRNNTTIFDPIKGYYTEMTTKPGEATWRFKALGGGLSGQIGLDRASVQNSYDEMLDKKLGKIGIALHVIKHPVNTLADLVSITEMGPRSSEIEASYKKYTSEKWQKDHPDWTEEDAFIQAFCDAQDVTVNFTKSGKWAKQINQVTAFFNVAIRGPEKLYRSIKERPIQTFVKGTLWLTTIAVASWYRNKDKDWYKNLPPAYKYNNLFFEINGKVFRLPIPFELGIIFMSAPQAVLDTMQDKDSKSLEGLLDLAKAQIPDPTPSVFQPALSVATNKNFLGVPIESEGMQYLYPTERKKDYTTKLAIALSKGMDKIGIQLSPIQLDYMLDSYSGGFLRQFRISGEELEDLPVLGDLMLRDPFYPKRQLNEYFSDWEVLRQKKQSGIATRAEIRELNRIDGFYETYKTLQGNITKAKKANNQALVMKYSNLLRERLERYGY